MSRPSPTVDRHLFASNASAYDSAWRTYGRSEGLDAARADRLEEQVPWATELADMDHPPVLHDEGGVGTTPLGSLPEAFLPLDGRLGFSVSGVMIPHPSRAQPGGRRRIATHTLLFDSDTFVRIDGYPHGLLQDLGTGGEGIGSSALLRQAIPSTPGLLTSISVPDSSTPFAQARRADVRRLADDVRGRVGRTVAVTWLEACWRAVREALRGGPGCVVVTEPGGDGDDPVASEIVRLAWLSLPRADRVRTYYSTFWLGGRRPEPCISTSPGEGRLRELAVDGSVAIVGAGAGDASSDGDALATWTGLVIDGGEAYDRALRRLDVREASLFEGRTLALVSALPRSPSGEVDLDPAVRMEQEGMGRWAGLGWMVGKELGLARGPGAASLPGAIMTHPVLATQPEFFDGLARALVGRVSDPGVGRLAVFVGARAPRRGRGLSLMVEGLGALVEAGVGIDEMRLAIEAVGRADGPRAAEEMSRIGIGLLRASGRVSELPHLLGVDRGDDTPFPPPVVHDLLDVVESRIEAGEDWDGVWAALMTRVWSSLAVRPGAQSADRLHRLAWLEVRSRGALTLTQLTAAGDAAAVALVRRMLDARPDPPLSVFLELRRGLRGPAGPSPREAISA